jgi:hypothetical protein
MQQFDYNKYLKNNPLLKENQEIREAKTPDLVIPANDADDMQEEADNFASILKRAGIMAKCKTGIGEVEVYLTDKSQASKASRVLQKAGYESQIAEAKEKNKDGDETWFSDANYFKKEHEGYKLKPTDMVAVGDSKAMTYAQAKKKFGGAMKEAKQIMERRIFTGTYRLEEKNPGDEYFDIFFNDKESGVFMMMNPEDAVVYGNSGIDLTKFFQSMVNGMKVDNSELDETE